MTANAYHFVTEWRVAGTPQEISAILGDGLALKRWWPAVYLDVKQLEPGDANGVGRVISLYTKGWLPYTLKWQFRVTESHHPFGFTLKAQGDFVGRGIWTIEPDGDEVKVTYDWSIEAKKPLLKYLSFVMKPLFGANHRWAMRRGNESLQLELRRRHAKSDAERAALPPPPQPTFRRLIPKKEAATALLPGV